jgi:hypothetical protein
MGALRTLDTIRAIFSNRWKCFRCGYYNDPHDFVCTSCKGR